MVSQKTVLKSDANSNQIYVEGEYIYLGKEGQQSERLAKFDLERKMLIVHKEYVDFISRFDAYGFNEALLRLSRKCDTVYLICPDGRYEIPITQVLHYGNVLIYPKQDLTRELFIELGLIKKYPAKELTI